MRELLIEAWTRASAEPDIHGRVRLSSTAMAGLRLECAHGDVNRALLALPVSLNKTVGYDYSRRVREKLQAVKFEEAQPRGLRIGRAS